MSLSLQSPEAQAQAQQSKSLCSERRQILTRPRVLLADDHPALLEATSVLLRLQFEIVGTATDGASLVSEALRLCPDVIVADITMPVLSGIDAAHRLRDSISPAKIVFLTVHSEEQFMNACMAEGALGYVLKSQMKAHLIPAIQAALVGETYISPFVPT
jgi:DNA-binding NarL/FixJ family response regulator